jgi:hypothetical protein
MGHFAYLNSAEKVTSYHLEIAFTARNNFNIKTKRMLALASHKKKL